MTRTRPTVLVLMGGPDAERPVSLLSGRQVAQALREADRFRVVERVIETTRKEALAAAGADVIFPVLHGPWGEGGPLQRILDEAGVPYVGCGPEAAATAIDKLATKRAVAAARVPTPPAQRLEPDDGCDLDPPLVVKPIDDGSSVDLAICLDRRAVAAARARLHPSRGAVMAEQYVRGREITVGIVLGQALPPIEIVPGEGAAFYDYESKYHRDDTRYRIDPPLPRGAAAACRRCALVAFELLGCRDVARADFIVDDRGPWFLEINTMPGFTTHSLVPMAAASAGLPMPLLCGRLVEAALARGPTRRREGRPGIRSPAGAGALQATLRR